MRTYNIDLHIHSCYAYRTSSRLTIENMIAQAKLVNIHVLGTGDILHTQYRKTVIPHLTRTDIILVLTTEISVAGIHYLLLFPTLNAVLNMYTALKPLSKDIDTNGRCNITIELSALRILCDKYAVLLGLAHAFSPKGYVHKWAKYPPITLDFVECGLDFSINWLKHTYTPANIIKSSDAHSLGNIGREYISCTAKTFSFKTLHTILKKGDYTLVGGVAQIGRYYASGRTKGTSEVVKQLKGSNLKPPSARIQIPLLHALSIYYGKGITSKFIVSKYELYMTTTIPVYIREVINGNHIVIVKEGKDGRTGTIRHKRDLQ